MCKVKRDETRASTDSSAQRQPIGTVEASAWMRKVRKLIGETQQAVLIVSVDGTVYITAVTYKVIPVCSAIVGGNTAINKWRYIMPVYYEAVGNTIYVCNRNGNVKTPLGAVNNIKLSYSQIAEVVDSLNSAYKAGYQTSLNQIRAMVDQKEVAFNDQAKRTAN